LDEDDIKILHKKKIAGRSFLKLTEEKLERYGIKGGPATVLVEFIERLSQKLQNYFSLKTLNDLKEMLHKNKVNGEDITSIKQFTQYYLYSANRHVLYHVIFIFLLYSLRGNRRQR